MVQITNVNVIPQMPSKGNLHSYNDVKVISTGQNGYSNANNINLSNNINTKFRNSIAAR